MDLLNHKWTEELMPAIRRTIISRLYYGVFHYVKFQLYGLDKDPNKTHKKPHEDAQKYATRNHIDVNIKDHLSQLQSMREQADYKRTQSIDDDFLKKAINIYNIVEKDCITIWNV